MVVLESVSCLHQGERSHPFVRVVVTRVLTCKWYTGIECVFVRHADCRGGPSEAESWRLPWCGDP